MTRQRTSAADVGQQYFELYHRAHRLVDSAMCASGLSFARVKVLMRLDSHGPMNQSALANLLGFAPRSVTETVDALEREGLVTRSQDEKDRRARIVALTPAGREAYQAARLVKKQVMDEIFGSLTTAQRAEFGALLDTIRTNLPSGEQQ